MRRTALIAALLAGSSTYAQVIAGGNASAQPQSPALPFVDRVSTLFDGERARATVAFLDQSVRWPGNTEFDASIAHIAANLEQAGYLRQDRARSTDVLVYRVEQYPMAQPAWEPVDATVQIMGDANPLLRFDSATCWPRIPSPPSQRKCARP